MRRFYLALCVLIFSSISLSAQTSLTAQNCIAIMGDSLPAGTFVAEIPGTGVTVLQSRHVAYILDDALQARDLIHYGVYDLSLSASAITDPNAEPYLTSREYFIGRELNCRFVVIFPFLNDLYTTDDGSTDQAIYQAGMTTMLSGIRTNSPNSHIIVMNYYHSFLQGVGDRTYGGDVTPAHVASLNMVHQNACTADDNITCLSTASVLSPINDYVVSNISRTDYQTFRYSLANPADQAMLDTYWANTPNNVIYGDGIHLNPNGQVRIVATLMGLFSTLEPLNFAPILR